MSIMICQEQQEAKQQEQQQNQSFLVIQRLNNRAAMCIETGAYDRATSALLKAMNLIYDEEEKQQQTQRQQHTTAACHCSKCSLDACLTISRRASDTQKQIVLAAQATIQSLEQPDNSTSSTDDDEEGKGDSHYVFKEAIRLAPIRPGHTMDRRVVRLVVAFNLALVSHLRALEHKDDNKLEKQAQQCLSASLNLYEMVALLMGEMVPPTATMEVVRTRFSMALCNNLSEIHRMIGNHAKYVACLKDLLSVTMMFVVEKRQDAIDLDGFLRNTSILVLDNYCAGQA